MKKMLFFFLPVIQSFHLYSQTDTSYLSAVNDLVRKHQAEGTIYYADKPIKDQIQSYTHYISSKKMVDRLNVNPDVKLTLTPKERLYIVDQLKRSLTHPVKDSLLPNSKRVPVEGHRILSYTRELNKNKIDSLLQAHDTVSANSFVMSKKMYYAFFFSNPIYLKNKKNLVIYFMWYAYDSGEEDLFFYKKENGSWIKWKTLGLGAF